MVIAKNEIAFNIVHKYVCTSIVSPQITQFLVSLCMILLILVVCHAVHGVKVIKKIPE